MAKNINTVENILARLEIQENGCHIWVGSKNGGYGNVGFQGKVVRVHRLAYEHAHGPIPAGLEIDHLCRNPACANPDHLEAVTHKENSRRGVAGEVCRARLSQITHCPSGHEYTEANTYLERSRKRHCRVCRNQAAAACHRRALKRKMELAAHD